MGPNLWNFLGFPWLGRDCPEFRGAVWVFNFENVALNHVCVWKMPGMGCGSVPKHGTEIVGILWRIYGLSVTVQKFSGCGLV